MVNDGQTIPPTLGYASLPDAAKEKANKLISLITYDGKSLIR